VVNFTGSPTSGVAPLTVSFTNLSSGATNYSWNFGDGHTTTATNAANTYSIAGTYTVSLTAIGAGGSNTLGRTNYIVVTNPPPVVANFTAGPTDGVAPLTVLFTNLSSGATNYNWDFGDGHVSASLNPTNTYTNAGIYSVSLTAIGAGGTNSLTQSNYVVVIQPPQLVVTPTSLDFGLITTGATVEASMVVSNSGAATLNGSASVSPGNFSIVSGTPFSLTGSGWTNLVMGFTSTTPGLFSNLVTFASNGGGSTNALSGRAINHPVLLTPIVSGTNFGFSFETLTGFTYVVKYKDSLTDPVWQMLQTVNGDGTTNTIAVPLSAAPQRFYELIVQ
jgi:PKD repeat protein